ncbi:50S ribosomal protein L17 [Striga asiatica]|uniref:50S ribosomal protein L17 n=1 Tax=Striga asiatica TaxID=4170 RepID=A0A5A7RGF7_STRAF|nr:50S ribosomal protein L17 [Striga asiatica]
MSSFLFIDNIKDPVRRYIFILSQRPPHTHTHTHTHSHTNDIIYNARTNLCLKVQTLHKLHIPTSPICAAIRRKNVRVSNAFTIVPAILSTVTWAKARITVMNRLRTIESRKKSSPTGKRLAFVPASGLFPHLAPCLKNRPLGFITIAETGHHQITPANVAYIPIIIHPPS